MNARRSLIILLSCLLLIAMPSQATEPTGECGPGSEDAEETHDTGEEDGPSEDPASPSGEEDAPAEDPGPSDANGTAEEDAPDDEDPVCAAMAAVCALVGISNQYEVNVDPDGCIWSKIDRIVNGADGNDDVEWSDANGTS